MQAQDPLQVIKQRQQRWAARKGTCFDTGGAYCATVDGNIFRGLSEAARLDFVRGDGTELGTGARPGKIQALHSSSALACNWFDYWRGRRLEPLSQAFDAPSHFVEFVGLEQPFKTGVGNPANLDAVFNCSDGSLFAIESKFTEPYTRSGSKTVLKPAYFTEDKKRWVDADVPECQGIADRLRSGQHTFRLLDVAQLLKHMLALGRCGRPWILCCIWYEVPGDAADQHRAELVDFESQLGHCALHFRALTYQELFERMAPVLGKEHQEYAEYLRDRYVF